MLRREIQFVVNRLQEQVEQLEKVLRREPRKVDRAASKMQRLSEGASNKDVANDG